jgi:hypothetical protein
VGVSAAIGVGAAIVTAGATVYGAIAQNSKNEKQLEINQGQYDLSKLGYKGEYEDRIRGFESVLEGISGKIRETDVSIKDYENKIASADRWLNKDDTGVSDWDRYYDAQISGQQAQITSLNANSQIAANNAANQIAQYDRWLANYDDMYAQQVQSKQASIDSLVAGRQVMVNNANNEIAQYDRWLANYDDMYAQQVQSKQASIDTLVASGKENYENFLNAIGYADAVAGATGRVGAGTSSSHITAMLDQKLVDYVGEDRTLDEHGGLFGSQLTAANMEMQQLKANLERQKMDVLGNKQTILDNLAITGWAYESQMKAAGMEMQQTKAMLEMQRANVMGDRNTTAANASLMQGAYSAQLGAAYKGLDALKIDLRNQYDDMVGQRDVWKEALTGYYDARTGLVDAMGKGGTELAGMYGEYRKFCKDNGYTSIFG